MTRMDEKNQTLLLLATGPLFACATSVFAALVVIGVLLVCAVCATAAKKVAAPSQCPLIVTSAISAIIVATLLIALITLSFSDIVAAFAPQIILAAFAAALLGTSEKPMPSAVAASTQIAVVGFLCELLGRGSLLGDYELAFAGATHAWLLRAVDVAPLPWLASPAGALLIAATVTAGLSHWRSRTATLNDALNGTSATITEPRSGRRVRVTGHIT